MNMRNEKRIADGRIHSMTWERVDSRFRGNDTRDCLRGTTGEPFRRRSPRTRGPRRRHCVVVARDPFREEIYFEIGSKGG